MMPTHIVVNNLGLTYKGTIGLSIATIPDVCKTPSPGGPIPLPYPNIANQSTLKDGTTTVLAKGGKMIAIKGSQYGMSSGDEPGTVGGVKSNVFKKATDWITYSFDVKMDGKNTCRHTDKKFHNDKNTVDLSGDIDPRKATDCFMLNIRCDKKMKRRGKKKWTPCMCKQLCAKVASLDRARLNRGKTTSKGKSLERVDYSQTDYNAYKEAYVERFAARAADKKNKMESQFAHPCAAKEWNAMNPRPANPTEGGSSAPFNADHLHDAALGGPLASMRNFKMLNTRVNTTIGAAMGRYNRDNSGDHDGLPIRAHPSCQCPDGPPDP